MKGALVQVDVSAITNTLAGSPTGK